MYIIGNFAAFLISGYLILRATDIFVKGAVDIGLSLRLSKVFIGVTIVSLVTTAPEFIVGVTTAYLGKTGLAVGNIIGSTICNIGLILAVGSLISDVEIRRLDVNYRILFLLGTLTLVYFFISDGMLSRVEAAFLLFLFIVFLIFNYHIAKRNQPECFDEICGDRGSHILRKGIIQFVIGGIFVVLLARYGLVFTAINIANYFQIPAILIGLTMVAIGTSIPELVTAVVSGTKKEGDLSFGNVIGANVFNLLLVMGTAGLVRPLSIDRQTIFFNMPVAIFITVVMFLFGYKDLRFSKFDGVVILAIYIAYICTLFFIMY